MPPGEGDCVVVVAGLPADLDGDVDVEIDVLLLRELVQLGAVLRETSNSVISSQTKIGIMTYNNPLRLVRLYKIPLEPKDTVPNALDGKYAETITHKDNSDL